MKKSKSDLLKKIHGGQICQLIGTCARLGIFDILYTKTASAEEVADILILDRDNIRMLLLGLESLHLVVSDDNVTFYLSEEGSYLAKKHTDTLQSIAIYKSSKPVWRSLEHLYEGIKTNTCPFEIAFHQKLYEYLDQNDHDFSIFHQAMALYEEKSSKKILDLYHFSQFPTIIDVGGGLGSFLAEILKRAPHSKGALLDRPKVIALLQQIHTEFVSSVTLLSGDFFEGIPSGYSLYVLRNILHNWEDQQALQILKQLHHCMSIDSSLVIFETLIEDEVNKRLGKFATINMFTMNSGGKERSLHEMDALLHQGGFIRTGLYQTTGSKSLIEARKQS